MTTADDVLAASDEILSFEPSPCVDKSSIHYDEGDGGNATDCAEAKSDTEADTTAAEAEAEGDQVDAEAEGEEAELADAEAEGDQGDVEAEGGEQDTEDDSAKGATGGGGDEVVEEVDNEGDGTETDDGAGETGGKTCVTIDVEGQGSISAELDTETMPVTTANFLSYVKTDFYAGTIFHRIIPGFMVQGGGMTKDMQEKETNPPIQNEAAQGGKNAIGTLAMARTGDPNSATAQFYINVADNASLDFKDDSSAGIGYAVFGHVIEGMDVVDKLAAVPTGEGDVPTTPVVISSVKISQCPS